MVDLFYEKKFGIRIAINKKICYIIIIVSNERKEKTMAKKKHDIGKIVTKVIATILAVLMVLAVAGTLIYYLVAA